MQETMPTGFTRNLGAQSNLVYFRGLSPQHFYALYFARLMVPAMRTALQRGEQRLLLQHDSCISRPAVPQQ